MTENKWIPVESETKPYYGQRILVTLESKNDGFRFMTTYKYTGEFTDDGHHKTLAWLPAPELYEPPKSVFNDEVQEAIMNHFTRTE